MDLGVLKGQVYSRANGINAMGQVVGFSGLQRDSSESRAFVWSSQTGMIDIGTLGGAYAQAYAINDAGYITGASQTQGMGPMATTHAFIYRRRLRRIGAINRMRRPGCAGWPFQLWHGHQQLQPCRRLFDHQSQRRARSCVLA